MAEEWLDLDFFDPSTKARRELSVRKEDWDRWTPEQRSMTLRAYADQAAALDREPVARAAEEATGKPLARLPTGELAEFGGESFGEMRARAQAKRSMDVEDQLRLFQNAMPEAQAQIIRPEGSSPQIVINRPDRDESILLDSGKTTTWMDFPVDFFHDVVNVENLLGGGGAALGIARKLGWASRMALTTIGGTLGAYTDEMNRRALGVENDVDSVWGMAARNFGIAAFNEMLPLAVHRRWGTHLSEEDKQLVKVWEDWVELARRGGAKNLKGALLADKQSLASKAAIQAKTASYRSKQKLIDREAMLKTSLEQAEKDTGGDLGRLSNDELAVMQLRIQDHMIRLTSPNFKGFIGGSRDDLLLMADKLKSGQEMMVKLQRAQFDKDYAELRALGKDVSFSLEQPLDLRGGTKSVLDTARDALDVAKMRKRGDVPGLQSDKAIEAYEMSKPLKDALGKILEADPEIAMFRNHDAFKQLQDLRKNFFDLKYGLRPDQQTTDSHIAGEIYDALTKLMDNPIGGDEQFRFLARAINERYKQFHESLEIPLIKELATTHEPLGVLAKILASPTTSARGVEVLAGSMPKAEWESAKEGVRIWLRENPETIMPMLERWKGMPEATFRKVVSKPQEEALVLWAKQMERVQKGPVAQALNRGLSARDAVRDVLSNPTPERLAGLGKALDATGGRDGQFGRALRRGLLMEIGEGGQSKAIEGAVDLRRLAASIEHFSKNGLLDAVMLPNEAELLKQSQFVFARSMSGASQDVGAAMQIGEVASGVGEAFKLPTAFLEGVGEAERVGGRAISAWLTVWKNYLVGTMLLGKSSERTMLAAAHNRTGEVWTRSLAVVGSRAVASLLQASPEDVSGEGKALLLDYARGVKDWTARMIADYLDSVEAERSRKKPTVPFDELEDEE